MKHNTRRRLLSVLTLCSGLLLLAACGDEPRDPRSNYDLLIAAVRNMQGLRSFHLEQGGEGVTEETAQVVGDFDLAGDKYRFNVRAGEFDERTIGLGDEYYLSTDGGKTWKKRLGTPAGDAYTGVWKSFSPEEVQKASNNLKDGTPLQENIEGDNTRHIVANAPNLMSALATGGASMDQTVEGLEFWVTTGETPYVRQIRVSGKIQGNDYRSVIQWSQFNETFAFATPGVVVDE